MATGDLEQKTEKAFIDWIAAVSTHSVTLGITARRWDEDDTDNLTLPACRVKAERQEELSPNTGVFRLQVEIELRANADDTAEATWQGYCQNLESILQWSALATALSAILDTYRVYGIAEWGPIVRSIEDRRWKSAYSLSIWADCGD